MRRLPREVLEQHHVFVARDNPFQRRARLVQALWRERMGLPAGERSPGRLLGSRLPLAFAEETQANLMTDAARAVAQAAIAAKRAGSGQKIEDDRLWANLLSSQPLAFNLFADLGCDLDTATRVFRRLWPERVSRDSRTFDSITLEAVVDAIEDETDAAWIRELRNRYLKWEVLDGF